MVEGDDELAERILGRGFLAAEDLERAPVESPPVLDDERYEVIELLGKGASGEVYKARDKELGRLVALKVLRLDPRGDSREELERFRREALALAALRHEGIPAVFDARSDERGARVVMELVDGRSFHSLLEEGLLSIGERVAIVEEVARIVHFAHERGFVHRDLKPSNVVLGRDGHPRVLDFGIARHVASDSKLTQRGDILGTPGFMSPEQALGRSRDVTARSDVFSLGAMLHHAISGALPFARLAELASADKAAPLLSGVKPGTAPALVETTRRALEKDPEKRHASALELADELRAWRRPRTIERRWLLVAGPVAVVALSVALALRGPARTVAPPAPPSPAPAPVAPPAKKTLEPRLDLLDARLAELDARLAERAASDPAGAERALDGAIRDLEAASAQPR